MFWHQTDTGNLYRKATDHDTGTGNVIIDGLIWAASRHEAAKIDATLAGKAAFLAGAKRVPAHDRAVMELIVASDHSPGAALDILNAWLTAWDKENLK
jgi:hypothetical protein